MTPLKTRLLRLAGVAAVFAIAVAACSGSASLPTKGDKEANGGSVGAPPGAPIAPGEGTDSDSVRDAVGDGTAGTTVTSDPLAIGIRPMVVRTGSVELEVADLDAALLRARAAIVGLGGYVSDSQRTNGEGQALATITYRIPANRWDEALDALGSLATRVVAETTQAVEVTAQVVDLDARISNLQATERALQGIMAKATKISDILDVQNQLTAVQGEIEQLTAHRNHLADQATYGTLAVTWTVPLVAVAEAAEGWNLAAELDRAFAQLVQVGQGLAVVGVWFAVVVLPIIAGIAIALALVFLLVRRLGLGRRPPAQPTPAGPPATT